MPATPPSATTTLAASLRARDVMVGDVITVSEHESLAAAWELLARAETRHLPVVRGRRIVGLLDDHAVVRARSTKWLDGTPRTVGDAAGSVLVVHEDRPVVELVRKLHDEDRCVAAVVDDHGHLLGLVTATALFGLLAQVLAG